MVIKGPVIKFSAPEKTRFAEKMMQSMFNTVNGKKIAFLRWALKKHKPYTITNSDLYRLSPPRGASAIYRVLLEVKNIRYTRA